MARGRPGQRFQRERQTSPIAGISSGTPATSTSGSNSIILLHGPRRWRLYSNQRHLRGACRIAEARPVRVPPPHPQRMWKQCTRRRPRHPRYARDRRLLRLRQIGHGSSNVSEPMARWAGTSSATRASRTWISPYSRPSRSRSGTAPSSALEIFNVFNHPIIANPYGAANGGLTGNDPSAPSTFGCGCATPDVVAGNPLVGSGSSRDINSG